MFIVTAFGLARNAFGIIQLADLVIQTWANLTTLGMKLAAADVDFGLPTRIQRVFAIGSVRALVGSIALLVPPRFAVPVFAASLAGSAAPWLGDLS